MNRGDFVWLVASGKVNPRPAVIIRARPADASSDRLVVVVGTKVLHEMLPKPVLIRKHSPFGRHCGLSYDTYFYGKIALAKPASVDHVVGPCLQTVFDDICRLIGER